MARKPYWELLRDPRWQRRRLEIMERAKFACEICFATERTLNVHHSLYRKGAMPWDYSDNELLCLCEPCHEDSHNLRSALDETLARLEPGSLEIILGYAEGLLAQTLDWDELDKREIRVRSYEHGRGLLDALWKWNTGDDGKPGADCMIDHGALDDRLVASLGEGEMPHPREKLGKN